MAKPGEPSADCPRCDSERVQIGYGNATLAAYCETCDCIQPIHSDIVTNEQAREEDFSDFEVRTGSSYGPDPWG